MFTSFTANDPQYLVRIDREKAKSLQVPFSQITDALQVYMGSVYVNDFDFNNRSYRVYVQADQVFRAQAKDIRQYYLRSDTGKMIPLDNVVSIESTANPQVITHYNLFRSAEIDGNSAPGRSSGQGIADMEALARKTLPNGMTFEWSGLSLEELESGGKASLLFGLGLIVVYLTLAAQYESFVLPFIVLLAVPVALLGAIGSQALRGLQNDVFCQIGLVMLIGLSSKNAILIVEFAEQLRAAGVVDRGGGNRGCADPVAADIDDLAGVYFGSCATCVCAGGWAGRKSFGGDYRIWRDDCGHNVEPVVYSGAVCAGAESGA